MKKKIVLKILYENAWFKESDFSWNENIRANEVNFDLLLHQRNIQISNK